ncbi:hypothetical protein KKF81_05135 [Candidatus Micrarchaeota archaeon]|nr:hypothetical protein [Candidatus Micrarchaeota archaeon]MBU1166311.1 hypothetical protein [Candidatus Micrarchaeota archaeon]MBU1886379.1 hypothetical protein [Candidatus Micrarchaeota archaeon]
MHEKNYILPTERDYEILKKCEKLEKLKLSKNDYELVEFIKTQLEDDWRTPLLRKLDSVIKRYSD